MMEKNIRCQLFYWKGKRIDVVIRESGTLGWIAEKEPKKVGGCRACETCYSTGKACSFDDDFNTIAPAILEADVIVFTTPVYWYSIPAQIKGVIDRIFALVVGGKDIAGKECALITCCEEDDMTVMDGVRIPFERMCALNKWKVIGEVLVPGVLNVGDIEKTDGCKKAAELVNAI